MRIQVTDRIHLTYSDGNTPTTGKRCYWAHVDGVMLRRKDGVGRMFYSEEKAIAAAKKAVAS